MPNIIDFKSKLNGGVRPNLYQVDIDFPARAIGALNGATKGSLMGETRYLCRSTGNPLIVRFLCPGICLMWNFLKKI